MKAESTIKRMITRLRKISNDESRPEHKRNAAYEAYHALRWVIEDTDWTPASFYGPRASGSQGRGEG